MITKKVKTLFQGMVGVRDKYLEAAETAKTDLQIEFGGEVMVIPYSELKARIKAKSDRPFYDKFGQSWHYLYYFDFKPDQPRLF